MSEQYAAGAMDPYIERALDRRRRDPGDLPHGQHGQPSAGLAAGHVICENCGRIGTTLASDWDGHEVTYDVPPGPGGLGHRLRLTRAASRRSAAAPSWSGTSTGPRAGDWSAPRIEGCGKDLATAGGSRDRADAISPAGLRARAAAQRALRVPQHRRQEDEHVQGHGCGGARDRRRCCRPSSLRFLFLRHRPRRAIEFDPEGDTIPGLFDEFDRICAAVAGQAGARRAAARSRAHLPP